MLYLDDTEIPIATADDLRRARKDAETIKRRLLGAYSCGVIQKSYEPHVVHSILDLFADIPTKPQHVVEALGDAMEALSEPYDETTEAKVERAFNLAAAQWSRCTTELVRRREPLDPATLSSRFIF